MELSFGLGVGGEPVLAVDLFAVGGEGGRKVLVPAAGVVGDVFAAYQNDLEILAVDPYAPLEITMVLLHHLGGGVENISLQLIHLLLAHIGHVVLAEVFRGQDER